MNKKEFIKDVAERANTTQKVVGDVLETMIDSIFETVSNGEDVKISGLGTFKVSEVAERTARNPRTGEEVLVPAHNTVKFKITQALKDVAR